LIVLVAVLGVVAWSAAHRSFDLAMSPQTAAPGDTIVVTADNLPANQAGQIELHSIVRTYGFRADANGAVNANVTLPRDIELGDHAVKICWSDACHQQLALHVIASVVAVSPLPSATPSALPSPSRSPTPSRSASPSPSSTAEACTGATPVLYVPSISKTAGFKATFRCFPAGHWSVSVVQLSKPYGAGSASTPGNTLYYTQSFSTPPLVTAGLAARVLACNASGRCYETADVTVGV